MARSGPFIYEKVKAALTELIAAQGLVPGDRLPSERELVSRLGCSHHSVRRGLLLLEQERQIERRIGSGTFVRETAGGPRSTGRAERATEVRTGHPVGLICPSGPDNFQTELLHHLHLQAERREMKLLIRTIGDLDLGAEEAGRELMARGCFALILPWVPRITPSERLWRFVQAVGGPLVLPGPVAGLERHCFEKPEIFGRASFEAVEMACCYFRALGYGNIAFFGWDTQEADLQRRILAYSRFASRHGLATHIALAGHRAEEVDAVVDRWSGMATDLAVVCLGDEDALRLMTAVHKRGLRIPEDVALMGFKNIPMAHAADPPLTTIQFDYDYVADGMLRHAEALAAGGSAQAEGRARQVLVVRESCGARDRAGDRLNEIVERVQEHRDEAVEEE